MGVLLDDLLCFRCQTALEEGFGRCHSCGAFVEDDLCRRIGAIRRVHAQLEVEEGLELDLHRQLTNRLVVRLRSLQKEATELDDKQQEKEGALDETEAP